MLAARSMSKKWLLGPIAGLMLTVAVPGCTQGERTFSAEEFVEEVNSEGVELELGEELSTDDARAELHAVELEPLIAAPPVPGEDEHQHAGGSLAVYDDTDAAEKRFEECMGAADLLCYQAANVVVILEGGGLEAQRLGIAIQKLADE